MEEHGIIVQSRNGTAVIRAQRSSACDGCASKKSCHSGSTGDNEILIEAENPVGAKVGDRVVFSVGAGSVVRAGLLLYLFPILSFIGGVVLGQAYVAGLLPGYNPDLVSGLLGLLFLALAFIALKLYGAVVERSRGLRPQVLRKE